MSFTEPRESGPVDFATKVDISNLAGKSVVITGGASGLGLAYAKAFVAAGAFVTIGDFDEVSGEAAGEELSPNAKFVKCDIREWGDQVALFETAVSASPSKGVDVVIANAGIIGDDDDMVTLQDPSGPPLKPDLRFLDTNLTGTMYTVKLAVHYLRRNRSDENGPAPDRCLIIKGSLSGYIDLPRYVQYSVSKWAVRSLFRNLQQTIPAEERVRINLVAPWFVRTPLFPTEGLDALASRGIKFASVEDCVAVMLRIASDYTVNGRAIGVFPREQVSVGYMDLELDDYPNGVEFLKKFQDRVLVATDT
ncbi:short chain dehydrogenase reductase [Xylariaceae sp. FL0255]|nr:short chain dehydrogenase reductase [Xylariaceae sp. FL0255]